MSSDALPNCSQFANQLHRRSSDVGFYGQKGAGGSQCWGGTADGQRPSLGYDPNRGAMFPGL